MSAQITLRDDEMDLIANLVRQHIEASIGCEPYPCAEPLLAKIKKGIMRPGRRFVLQPTTGEGA